MFPEIQTVADVTTFLVIAAVEDKFLKEQNLTLKETEELIEKVLKVDAWKHERNVSLRATILIGQTSMQQPIEVLDG